MRRVGTFVIALLPVCAGDRRRRAERNHRIAPRRHAEAATPRRRAARSTRRSTTRSSTGSCTRRPTTVCSPSRRPAATTRSPSCPTSPRTCPTPTNGGKTWVFKLRKGIKFSNGQPLTVNDVVASFQRIFKVKSPTSGSFYAGIVGAQACLKKPATCTLKGGVVGNAKANTVTINLTAPDSEFKYRLAVPHASIVPANSPPNDARHEADPRHRRVLLRLVRPEQGARDEAQPVLQGSGRRTRSPTATRTRSSSRTA